MIELQSKEKHALNTKEEHATNTINYNPKAFTTKRKKPKKPNLRITPSMLLSNDEMVELGGLFEGKLVHLSFDCPLNLRTAFNREVRANGNSVCKLLQQYMSAYISASMVKKHAIGNTYLAVAKRETTVNVDIAEMNFSQHVQSRPRRLIRSSVAEVSEGEVEASLCEIGGGVCRNSSSCEGVYLPTGKKYRLCRAHMELFSSVKEWRLLS